MRIAFVGKGGSGKTTLASLFALYLDTIGKRVGLLDVDVNSHTAEVLGYASEAIPKLSSQTALSKINTFLAGKNPRINPAELLNTTPPGTGSGRWSLDKNNIITQTYGLPFGERSHVFTLGSYSGTSIGADCHHTTQHVAENLLSHASLAKNDVLVVDSVAGNDTFANSLYLQDILLFVLKPEREGLSVYERYLAMAIQAGVEQRVYVVGNHVNSELERTFLTRHIPADKLLGMFPTNTALIAQRLENQPLTVTTLTDAHAAVFSNVAQQLAVHSHPPQKFYDAIIALHRQVAAQAWVAGAYRKGLDDQIDPDYTAD